MPMSPRLLRPRASGVHPEAAAWRSSVVAGGGSVSAKTLDAVSKFCAAIDQAGIRSRFLRLNLFCGNSDSNLVAVRTPLYRAASRTDTQLGDERDTSNAFVASTDYAENSGLTGNGSTKRFVTGLAGSSLAGHNLHLAVYAPAASAGTFDALLGVRSNFNAPAAVLSSQSPATLIAFQLGNNGIQITSDPANGMWMGVQTGSLTGALYRNGTSLTTSYITGSATTNDFSTLSQEFSIFCLNDGGSPNVFRDFSAARMAGYSIGLSMDATQAAAYYTAMQAFQTALGRNV
jgi:hypothetical protein